MKFRAQCFTLCAGKSQNDRKGIGGREAGGEQNTSVMKSGGHQGWKGLNGWGIKLWKMWEEGRATKTVDKQKSHMEAYYATSLLKT